MERLWMTLDQIKAEYASNDYNPELLLQHLLHHVEASPASAPEGWKDFLQDLTQKISEAMYHTPDYFHRDMVRLAHRAHKLLAAAPTPPVSEDRKDAERYRWLRDIGNNTWEPMIKRGTTATQCDSAIDAEIAATQEDKS